MYEHLTNLELLEWADLVTSRLIEDAAAHADPDIGRISQLASVVQEIEVRLGSMGSDAMRRLVDASDRDPADTWSDLVDLSGRMVAERQELLLARRR